MAEVTDLPPPGEGYPSPGKGITGGTSPLEVSMWEPGVSPGGIIITVGWVAAPALIVIGRIFNEPVLGQLGIVVVAGAATLSIIRDNQRTRRMLGRRGEQLASVNRTRDDG